MLLHQDPGRRDAQGNRPNLIRLPNGWPHLAVTDLLHLTAHSEMLNGGFVVCIYHCLESERRKTWEQWVLEGCAGLEEELGTSPGCCSLHRRCQSSQLRRLGSWLQALLLCSLSGDTLSLCVTQCCWQGHTSSAREVLA